MATDYILWNRCEGDVGGVMASEVGPDFAISGSPTFQAGKWGDGSYLDAYTEILKATMDINFKTGKFCIEGYHKADYDLVDGVPQDGNPHSLFNIGRRTDGDSQASHFIMLQTAPFGLQWQYQTVGGAATKNGAWSSGFSWSAGVWNHIAFVGDYSLGSSNLKAYLDGILICEGDATFSDDSLNGRYLWLGYGQEDWDVHNDAEYDNVKFFDYAKSDFSDINSESGASLVPEQVTGVSATDGDYTTRVRVSWDTESSATSYNVYRSTTKGGSYTKIAAGITDTYYDDSSVSSDVRYWYKVSAVNGSGEGDLSDPDVGYAHAAPALDIRRYKVLILNNEIDLVEFGYVMDFIKIDEKKTFQRDKLTINQISIKVKNTDDFFSVNNNSSIFKATNWRYEPCVIVNSDGEIIWDGIIYDIERDHARKTATIISCDRLSMYLKKKVEYTSADWETPADAVKNIFDAIGFTAYNTRAMTASISQYEANGCYIKCNFTLDADMTLQQAIEKIAEFGCADCYSSKNLVHFKHWRPFTGGVKVHLPASDLKEAPNVWSLIDELYNDYHIGYYGDLGVSATDNGSTSPIAEASRQKFETHDLPELCGRENNQIMFKDLASAQYIGNCYILRTHYSLAPAESITAINFSLPITCREWIDLETYFTLTLAEESWTDKKFEIFATTIDYNKRSIDVTAYGVPE